MQITSVGWGERVVLSLYTVCGLEVDAEVANFVLKGGGPRILREKLV